MALFFVYKKFTVCSCNRNSGFSIMLLSNTTEGEHAMEQIRINDEYVMFGSYNQGDCIDQLVADAYDFVPLVRDSMGNDAADFVSNLIDLCENGTEADEDWEIIADGYHGMLNDTMTELEAILDKAEDNPGMSKKKLVEAVREVYNNIYNNM